MDNDLMNFLFFSVTGISTNPEAAFLGKIGGVNDFIILASTILFLSSNQRATNGKKTKNKTRFRQDNRMDRIQLFEGKLIQ